MEVIIQSAFFYFLAFALAAIEIESEGKYGWADNAPTWYRKHGFVAKVYGMIMNGKPLTGYHLFMFIFTLLMFHIHFFLGVEWSITKEFVALSFYFVFCTFWDFMWFILNPYYGIKNFQKEKIWWHAKSIWLCGVPMDYIGAIFLSIVMSCLASIFSDNWGILKHHLTFIALTIGCGTILTILFAPYYHRWYHKMRKHDERELFDRFYK